jgi:hypothetical protein
MLMLGEKNSIDKTPPRRRKLEPCNTMMDLPLNHGKAETL